MKTICVIGGGPAGLMAAERLSARGYLVRIYDQMPTVGRKWLMAGKSGLNITHTEDTQSFLQRYDTAADWMRPMLESFGADAVRRWADGLGAETFVGSSGRVFPKAMKGSPLLRNWIARLKAQGCLFHTAHSLHDISDTGTVAFKTGKETVQTRADGIILALGGASWPRLGSDAAWVSLLRKKGIQITPFAPVNCGFDVDWSEAFCTQYAGCVIKNVIVYTRDTHHTHHTLGAYKKGDVVISYYGVEGGTLYAVSKKLRDRLPEPMLVDMLPDLNRTQIRDRLKRSRGKNSLSNHLRKTLKLDKIKLALLRECVSKDVMENPDRLAQALKALPVKIRSPRPLAEAISVSGGIALSELDNRLQLHNLPGVYAAGEMLDWDAPTGGYLITACLAQGHWVGTHL